MSTTSRILVVDDDRDFNETLAERLGEEGYSVDSAMSFDEALAALEKAPPDLVLLDRKLGGQSGPDTSLDRIGEIRSRAPAAKIILITAFADPSSVNRAFQAGVFDYLEKNQFFEAILLVKVRNALEAIRERRFAALANGKREEAIRELWRDVQAEKNSQRKGKLLEDLLLLLFKSIHGFERAEVNLRSQDEEIDLMVPNESPDPFWQKDSQYFLIECKNWSARVGPKEINHFLSKMEGRHGRCQTGFFVALNGVTAGVESSLAKSRKESFAVALLQEADIQRLVDAGGGTKRNEILKELHRNTVLRG